MKKHVQNDHHYFKDNRILLERSILERLKNTKKKELELQTSIKKYLNKNIVAKHFN